MRFFTAAGFGLGIAGGAMISDSIPAGIGLLVAAFFLILSGYRIEQQ